MPHFIDAHVHVWTPDTAHYPLASGYKKEDMHPPSFTPEDLFKHTKPVGVDRVNLIQMSWYGFDNSYMIHMIALHKGVFSGTAVIDPQGAGPGKLMGETAERYGAEILRPGPRPGNRVTGRLHAMRAPVEAPRRTVVVHAPRKWLAGLLGAVTRN